MQSSGILLAANHLPGLPRQRPGDPRAVPPAAAARATCSRRSPARSTFRAGVDDGTRLRLHRRRRAEPQRRPARRLLLLHPRQGASAVPARRAGPALPGADQLSAGGAGGDDRGAHARRPRGDRRSRRHADRRRLHAPGPRHARPAIAAAATCWCRSPSKCPSGSRERHEQLLRELAEIENSEVSPKRKRFFEKLKELFHADRKIRPARRLP